MDNSQMQSLLQSLKTNQNALQSIMTSRDGQTLIRQLTQKDGGAALQRAATNASRGNTAELAQMIGQLMQSQEGSELVNRINNSIKK